MDKGTNEVVGLSKIQERIEGLVVVYLKKGYFRI